MNFIYTNREYQQNYEQQSIGITPFAVVIGFA